MALQFLVGCIVSVIIIMIHALVTVGAVGIARSAALRHSVWPRSHLMAVMVVTAVALMVAHTHWKCWFGRRSTQSSARRQPAAI